MMAISVQPVLTDIARMITYIIIIVASGIT